MPKLNEYKDIIIKLYELGVLSTLKEITDSKGSSEVSFKFAFNDGGIRSAFEERVRTKLK